MKLRALVVSDHESEYIWDYFDASVFKGVDVIVSCGDLKAEYLSFLVTMIPAPLLYVAQPRRTDDQTPGRLHRLEGSPLWSKGVRSSALRSVRQDEPNHYSGERWRGGQRTSGALKLPAKA